MLLNPEKQCQFKVRSVMERIMHKLYKARFQYKPRIFFLFCDLDFMYYLGTLGGIHENCWQENLKTIGGIHETR